MPITAVIISAIFLVGILVLAITHPNMFTWLAVIFWAGIFFVLILPSYFNTQEALKKGEEVIATVENVRHWSHKYNSKDSKYHENYEIQAVWQNPRTGQSVKFISTPLKVDPTPYLTQKTVKVRVNPDNPKQYIMDLSFMPKQTFTAGD